MLNSIRLRFRSLHCNKRGIVFLFTKIQEVFKCSELQKFTSHSGVLNFKSSEYRKAVRLFLRVAVWTASPTLIFSFYGDVPFELIKRVHFRLLSATLKFVHSVAWSGASHWLFFWKICMAWWPGLNPWVVLQWRISICTQCVLYKRTSSLCLLSIQEDSILMGSCSLWSCRHMVRLTRSFISEFIRPNSSVQILQ